MTRQIEVIQGKGTKMKRLSRVLQMTVAVFAICLTATTPAQADISNGDFSEGDEFWTVPTDDYDYPTEGAPGVIDDAYWIELGDEDAKVVGFDGRVATLEESPWYDHDHDDNPNTDTVSFTRIQQNVTVLEGETALCFELLLTTEGEGQGPETDWLDVLLNVGSTENVVYTLTTEELTGGVFDGEVTVPDVLPGEYTLMFRLVGDDDDWFTSATVDNVRLVPVPGAVLLGGLGFCTAGWFCRRERRV